MPKKIILGSDHGGLDLKNYLKNYLENKYPTYQIEDIGTFSSDSVPYPTYALKVTQKVLENKTNLGILVCGTGIGMSIMANRIQGIRAALITNEFTAQMAKKHNNANIICLGDRTTSPKLAEKMTDLWLNSTFQKGRHQKRLDMLDSQN
jgi:ribose 5-phosphate isomerase B